MPKNKEVIASAILMFKKLELKNDLQWYLSLLLKATLPQTFREYSLKFSLNEEPFNIRIKDLQRKKEDLKANKQDDLFPSEGAKKTQLKNIDVEIKEVEEELAEQKRETPEFEFEATVMKLEYKDGDTFVSFLIEPSIVAQINDVKMLLDRYYKVELIRE